MGLAGVLQQLYRNAMYGCCMDITSPSRAPYMYMIQTLFDGCGSTAGSVIAGEDYNFCNFGINVSIISSGLQ